MPCGAGVGMSLQAVTTSERHLLGIGHKMVGLLPQGGCVSSKIPMPVCQRIVSSCLESENRTMASPHMTLLLCCCFPGPPCPLDPILLSEIRSQILCATGLPVCNHFRLSYKCCCMLMLRCLNRPPPSCSLLTFWLRSVEVRRGHLAHPPASPDLSLLSHRMSVSLSLSAQV